MEGVFASLQSLDIPDLLIYECGRIGRIGAENQPALPEIVTILELRRVQDYSLNPPFFV